MNVANTQPIWNSRRPHLTPETHSTPDRRIPGRDIGSVAGGFAVLALAAVTALVGACGTSASSNPPNSGAPATASTSASAAPASAARTFPPPQAAIEPGTYRWDGFERAVTFTVGTGWAIGHDNPMFFDLFRGSDFPSISFARFTDVYVDGTKRVAAVDAATVAATLKSRAGMTVTGPSAIELGGLDGRQLDLATSASRTPLFFGPAGDFRLDPEFKTRYRVLDFPGGGILVVGIHARAGGFEDGVALGDPVVATLIVDP